MKGIWLKLRWWASPCPPLSPSIPTPRSPYVQQSAHSGWAKRRLIFGGIHSFWDLKKHSEIFLFSFYSCLRQSRFSPEMNTFFIKWTITWTIKKIYKQTKWICMKYSIIDILMDVKARKQWGDVVLGILDESLERKNICMYICIDIRVYEFWKICMKTNRCVILCCGIRHLQVTHHLKKMKKIYP